MLFRDLNLVIPESRDTERDLVAEAWSFEGGIVTRIGRFWDPPQLDPSAIRIYGNDTFGLVLAQKFNLTLISPADDLLAKLPDELLGRKLTIRKLEELSDFSFPTFVKSVVPKQFRAGVYSSSGELSAECTGLVPETQVYISEIVRFSSEVRGFILNDQVEDSALYEGSGSIEEAQSFLANVSRSKELPDTCVVDVGYIDGYGWVVIELNATWGAGLNGCSAKKILGCIAQATKYAA